MSKTKERLFITTNDIYKEYYLKDHDVDHKRFIDYPTWKILWDIAAKKMSERLVNKGQVVLPHILGKIKISKTKTKKKPVNWGEFRKTGKITYYDNQHTDDYLLKCQWVDRPFFSTLFLFNFDLCRDTKKNLSKFVKKDGNNYHIYGDLVKNIKYSRR